MDKFSFYYLSMIFGKDLGEVSPHDFENAFRHDFGLVSSHDSGVIFCHDLSNVSDHDFGKIFHHNLRVVFRHEIWVELTVWTCISSWFQFRLLFWFKQGLQLWFWPCLTSRFKHGLPKDLNVVFRHDLDKRSHRDFGNICHHNSRIVFCLDLCVVFPHYVDNFSRKDFGKKFVVIWARSPAMIWVWNFTIVMIKSSVLINSFIDHGLSNDLRLVIRP